MNEEAIEIFKGVQDNYKSDDEYDYSTDEYHVAKELKKAKKYHLNKEHMDYDLTAMIEEQHHLHDKYECKIHECYGK